MSKTGNEPALHGDKNPLMTHGVYVKIMADGKRNIKIGKENHNHRFIWTGKFR